MVYSVRGCAGSRKTGHARWSYCCLDTTARNANDIYTVYRGSVHGGRRRSLSIKHAILGLLAGGPLHGYDLKTAYEGDLVPAAQLNFGQVYTTLDRLHR